MSVARDWRGGIGVEHFGDVRVEGEMTLDEVLDDDEQVDGP